MFELKRHTRRAGRKKTFSTLLRSDGLTEEMHRIMDDLAEAANIPKSSVHRDLLASGMRNELQLTDEEMGLVYDKDKVTTA